MNELDDDGALALLGAIARQWLEDSRRHPEELAALARWLDMTLPAVEARMAVQRSRALRQTTGRCELCGASMVIYLSRGGKPQRYCGARCRKSAAARRARQRKRVTSS